jgi:hypothetical protein
MEIVVRREVVRHKLTVVIERQQKSSQLPSTRG